MKAAMHTGRMWRILRVMLTGRVLFPLLVTAIGAYVALASLSYRPATGLFAGTTAGIMVALSIVVLFREIRRRLGPAHPARAGTETQPRHSPVVAFAWCGGFFVSVLLIGYVLTVPVWVFFFLLWNRASRVLIVVLPLVLWALTKFALGDAAGTLFFEGIVFGGRLPRFW